MSTPQPSSDRRARMRFSAHGRTWIIVLRGGWGRAVDRWLVRWTGVSAITWQYATAAGRHYTPTLLLTTIGARSGRLRTSALPFFRIDSDLVVVGSNGGGPSDPNWCANLRADPHCWLRVRRRLVPATGRIVEGVERDELFERLATVHLGLRRYQEQASTHGRAVPLVRLSPLGPVPPPRRRRSRSQPGGRPSTSS